MSIEYKLSYTASEIDEKLGKIDEHSTTIQDLQEELENISIPTSLPANGGNADTVDGKHADEFALAEDVALNTAAIEENANAITANKQDADAKFTSTNQSITTLEEEVDTVKGDLTSHATSSNSQFTTIREEFAAKDTENLTTAKEYSDANKSAAVSEAKTYTDSEIEKLVTDTEFEGVLSTIQEIQNAMATDDELAQALETANGKKVDKGAKGSTTKPIYFDENGAQEIAYSIEKDVPADAKFSDTTYTLIKDATQKKIQLMSGETLVSEVDDNNTIYEVATTSSSGLLSAEDKTKLDGIASGANAYTHPTTSGNKHIPSGGSEGQVLTYSADGTAQWSEPPSSGIDGLTATVDELNYSSGLTGNIQEQLDELNNLFFLGDLSFELNLNSVSKSKIVSLLPDMTAVGVGGNISYITDRMFYNADKLNTVKFIQGIKYIGTSAFYKCTSLTSVTIPEGVERLGDYVFYNCSSLNSVILPDSLIVVGQQIFKNSPVSKTIVNGCHYINNHLVQLTSSYNNIVIRDGTKTIASYLANSHKMTSVTIPEGVRGIGDCAFYCCNNLTSVNLPDSLIYIGQLIFNGTPIQQSTSQYWTDGVLCVGNHILYTDKTLSGDYVIKDNIKCIASVAFSDCTSLTSITIPEGVKGIGDFSFQRCSSITTITIPSSVEYIGFNPFSGCDSLKTVNISEGCSNYFTLNGITFDKNQTRLIKYNTDNVETDYIVPSTINIIDSNAFYKCESLKSITLPRNILNINAYTFAYCTSLTSITIPDGVETIGSYAFNGCTSLTSIIIPDSVEEICNYAFSNCDSLTSIIIPHSVTEIDNRAFSGCDSLQQVVIQNGVKTIGSYAFIACKQLTSIVIPNSVTSIGDDAFSNCTGLSTVILSNNITKINNYTFSNCSALTSVTIPDSVTSIGNYAFYKCSSLADIVIPDSVNTIGTYAFWGTAYYNDLSNWENETVLYMSNHLIAAKSSISGDYVIKEGTKNIVYRAFDGCANLTSVVIPDGVSSVNVQAFRNCTSLTSVTIPTSVTTIASNVFYGCTALTDVYYTGTEEQWAAISISSGNDYLTNATIHYNYTGE